MNTKIMLLEGLFDAFSDFDWGKIIVFSTIAAFVIAIVMTIRYVDKKYLSDDKKYYETIGEKPKKKGKK